jgi:hypothetical protein
MFQAFQMFQSFVSSVSYMDVEKVDPDVVYVAMAI